MADPGELDVNERDFRARLKGGFRRFLTGDLGPGLGTKGAELLRTMTADQKDRIIVDLGDLEKCLTTPDSAFAREQLLEEPHRFMPTLEQALIEAKVTRYSVLDIAVCEFQAEFGSPIEMLSLLRCTHYLPFVV